MSTASLTIQARHLDALRALLRRDDGVERAAYVLCGAAHIGHDPWDRQGHRTFVSYEVVPVPEDQVVSASSQHITWTTTSFVRALQVAQTEGLTVAVVHSHPSGLTSLSAQDDRNEADLVDLAQHRNGPDTPLVSLLLTPAGDLQGRVWTGRHAYVPLRLLQVVGESIRLQYPGRGHGQARPALARQALAFGTALNQDLAMLRVGVVGCGGTGSATALLLARLGVGQLALFDPDVVECTNLNRLHGARQADADALRPKVEVVARALTELGLGVRVVPLQVSFLDTVRHGRMVQRFGPWRGRRHHPPCRGRLSRLWHQRLLRGRWATARTRGLSTPIAPLTPAYAAVESCCRRCRATSRALLSHVQSTFKH